MSEVNRLADITDEWERRSILEQIVLRLSFKERNELVRLVLKRNDFLTVLPTELVLEILAYLPILQVWSLQLVCRQWRSVLSSDHVLRAVVSRWECDDSADSASRLRVTEELRSKIRRMQAMRLGRPFTSRLFTDHIKSARGVLQTQADRNFTLKGRLLAYIRTSPIDGDCVVVLDLVSNKELNFCGAARERIMSIASTTNIIAFVTYSGKLYAPDLANSTSLLKAVQLPSADILALHADGNIVCLAIKASSPASFIMAIYDCTMGTLKASELSSPSVTVGSTKEHLSPRALLVNAVDATVDVFSQRYIVLGMNNSREDVFVEHRRYSFDGRHISSSRWQRLGTPRFTKSPFELGDLHPTGEPGRFVMRTMLLQSSLAPDRSASPQVSPPMSLLVFDYNTAKLGEEIFPGESQRPNMQKMSDYTSLMLWKDVEVRAVGNLLFTSSQNDPTKWDDEGRYRLRNAINMIMLSGITSRSAWGGNDTSYSILVNDTFIVAFEQVPIVRDGQSCIKIFCFDGDLQWIGAKKTRLWEVDANQECKFASWDGTLPKLPR